MICKPLNAMIQSYDISMFDRMHFIFFRYKVDVYNTTDHRSTFTTITHHILLEYTNRGTEIQTFKPFKKQNCFLFFNMESLCCTLCFKVHLQCKFVYLTEVRSGSEADFLSTCILLFSGCAAVKNRTWFSIAPPQTSSQAYC